MEFGKVNTFMDKAKEVTRKGGRLSTSDREMYDDIRGARLLDKVDASVLVYRMEPIMDNESSFTWEEHEFLHEYSVDQTGNLSVFLGGRDADGDWGIERVVVYPAGRWQKFQTTLNPIHNPHFIDPDKPEPTDIHPAGFHG